MIYFLTSLNEKMTDETPKEQFLKVLEENIRIVQKIAGVYTRNTRDREDLINDITLYLTFRYSILEQFRKLNKEIAALEQLER